MILASIGVFAAVLFLSRTASSPALTLLYAGLDEPSAGEIITALDQRGVTYDVRGNAIYVDSSQRDSLRLTLASEGLPRTSGTGYELLDNLSGFGTTAQMFDAAYWRAKEGELARTILASSHYKSARVHISNSVASGFTRASDASASVFVTPSYGSVSAQQAKALKYLIASAVNGLKPDRVSVIDGSTGAVISTDAASGGDAADAEISARLKHEVQRLLEARVGPGNVAVVVSVRTQTDRESIIERRFDPEGRVAISTVTEETTGTTEGQLGGAVTVASNLPDGDAAEDAGSSRSQTSETREQTNWDVSETQTETIRGPGAIERLSVAVMLNGTREVDANGAETWSPRSAEELATLKALVASAVGFEEDRGDVITLESLAFESVPEVGTTASLSFLDRFGLDLMHLISMAVLAIVALALGMFVVRPILTASAALTPAPALPVAPEPDKGELDVEIGSALDGEIDDGSLDLSQMPMMTSFNDGSSDLPDIGAPLGSNTDPVARLKHMISDRKDETVEILQDWINSPKEKV